METGDWLPPAIAGRDLDVSAQDTHRLRSVGARDWLATEMSIRAGVLNSMIALARSPSASPEIEITVVMLSLDLHNARIILDRSRQ
jgi:hypothetical protein